MCINIGLLVFCQPQTIFCLFSKGNTARGSTKAGRSNVAGCADNARGADLRRGNDNNTDSGEDKGYDNNNDSGKDDGEDK